MFRGPLLLIRFALIAFTVAAANPPDDLETKFNKQLSVQTAMARARPAARNYWFPLAERAGGRALACYNAATLGVHPDTPHPGRRRHRRGGRA